MSKIIMHVDLNAFFATAEELRHPEWVDKPIIVGGTGARSVVSTASYAARKYGIHSAMPIYQARQLCPEGVFLPCDFAYYEMLSQSFFAYLKRYSLLIEEASIDEGYVDMTKALSQVRDPYAYFEGLQKGLLKEIGLKCSIGVAPTKFLAKMASDMKKPMGITILRRRDLSAKLYPLPIESFYGIGKKSAPRLREMGIATIGDLNDRLDTEDPALKEFFGKGCPEVQKECRGYGDDAVDPRPFDPKSIGHSETFPYDTEDREEIEAKIRELATEVAEGAKRDGKKGKTVELTVKDHAFHSFNKSVSFKEATDSADLISSKALELYEGRFLGRLIRLVGVTLQNLVDPREETVQMNFFNYQDYEAMDQTKLLINALNRKMGKPALKLAAEVKKNGHK
jgi:DNA polymerase-4